MLQATERNLTNHFWLLIFRLLQNQQQEKKINVQKIPASSFQFRCKNVYFMSSPQMQQRINFVIQLLRERRVCFTRYWELRGLPAAFTPSSTDLLIGVTHVAANACGAGGPNAWQPVQPPSSHRTAPPQLLLLEKYTSNFGFVISNWSNPLNGFPGHQSACQKDRGRETARRNRGKSPSLKIK